MAVWQKLWYGASPDQSAMSAATPYFCVPGPIDGRLGLTSENARRKTIMGMKTLGKVKAGTRLVRYRGMSEAGGVSLRGSPGFFGGGDMKKIGITAKNSGDAMVFAKAWLGQITRK